MTRLGYQIPNFTYPGHSNQEIFKSVIAQAKAAEAAGYDNAESERLQSICIGNEDTTVDRHLP